MGSALLRGYNRDEDDGEDVIEWMSDEGDAWRWDEFVIVHLDIHMAKKSLYLWAVACKQFFQFHVKIVSKPRIVFGKG